MTAFPEFPRVCEELHGEFEHLVVGMQWRARFRLFFGDQQAFLFQSGDLLLVGQCDGCVVRINDPVDEGFDL
ncbi:MAG: hypothetical protein NXH91_17500 [Phyllobacteriaceae bacterium]|nr:hypothetical protein [Phyllobacteriaceae bacterium]